MRGASGDRRATPLIATPARRRQLRAAEPTEWDWLGFSRFEVQLATMAGVLLGGAYVGVAATTPLGGLGMFALGAMLGALVGLRTADYWHEVGRVFRWSMIAVAVFFVIFDVAVVVQLIV